MSSQKQNVIKQHSKRKSKELIISYNSNYSLEYCFALLRVENNPLWERRVRPSVQGPNLPIYILTIHTVWKSDPPWPLGMALKVKIQNVDETYTTTPTRCFQPLAIPVSNGSCSMFIQVSISQDPFSNTEIM
jgi:hypothetical protein